MIGANQNQYRQSSVPFLAMNHSFPMTTTYVLIPPFGGTKSVRSTDALASFQASVEAPYLSKVWFLKSVLQTMAFHVQIDPA